MMKTCGWLTVKISLCFLPSHTSVLVYIAPISIEHFIHPPHAVALVIVYIPSSSITTWHSEMVAGCSGCMLENTAVVILRTLTPFLSTCTIQTSSILFIIYCFVEHWQDSCLCYKEKKKKIDDRRPHSAPRTCNLRQKIQT